jgi:hypothetical protein
MDFVHFYNISIPQAGEERKGEEKGEKGEGQEINKILFHVYSICLFSTKPESYAWL